jgi:hypothetical protein
MNDAAKVRGLKRTLLILVFTLTFEGIARKLNIAGTSVLIFFIKDFIVAWLGVQLLGMRRPKSIDFLWGAYVTVLILFLPLVLATAFHDPILAVFGAKQYLLYPIVALGVFSAFENSTIDEVVTFYRWVALLILSVEGESVTGFMAGGQLRVSSSFSFVAQYCIFLNAEMFILMIALVHRKNLKPLWRWTYLALVPMYILSCYITGSRGAVVGAFTIAGIAVAISPLQFDSAGSLRLVGIIAGFLGTIAVVQYFFPNEFAAYSAREEGHLVGVSSEIQQRVYDAMFGWMDQVFSVPFLGSGLGIMSNGSDSLSRYAASFRDVEWTETDFASSLFEGGIYLILVWYGFRYYVIYQTTRRFLATPPSELSTSASFCQGFIIIIGLTATLGIQPPMAIWWWFAVGSMLIFWWKAVEPKTEAEKSGNTPPPPPTGKKVRGRSLYAERLHAGKEARQSSGE